MNPCTEHLKHILSIPLNGALTHGILGFLPASCLNVLSLQCEDFLFTVLFLSEVLFCSLAQYRNITYIIQDCVNIIIYVMYMVCMCVLSRSAMSDPS